MSQPDSLARIIAGFEPVQASLLPICHAVQSAFGCVDAQAETAIAVALNLSRAEVHGVVSFYHDFRTERDDRPLLQLCGAEACQARGVEALAAGLPAEGRVRVETVFCLGLCSVGPCARLGDAVHARLDAGRLLALIEGAA
ncbi:MAG: NAD(P)H-dependent oxidoreductase subunit E [Sphingomonadales bacterium]|nr:NAD(P)H-dependent oxidoreductase subunit E [Sphingomonadales bacterium]